MKKNKINLMNFCLRLKKISVRIYTLEILWELRIISTLVLEKILVNYRTIKIGNSLILRILCVVKNWVYSQWIRTNFWTFLNNWMTMKRRSKIRIRRSFKSRKLCMIYCKT